MASPRSGYTFDEAVLNGEICGRQGRGPGRNDKAGLPFRRVHDYDRGCDRAILALCRHG